ncbi:MAG: type I DNA topoisomerase, partial [Elusimicrobiota bacterium]
YKYRTTIFKKFEDTVPIATFLRNTGLIVKNIESKTLKQKPRPPFITSTLQQDAYNRLGFSSERTMRIAQSLYEGVDLKGERVGLITYMRTDSFNVSHEIQNETRKFILKTYGKTYLPQNPPFYQTKVKSAQEAHEAIHPTSVDRTPEDMKQYVTGEQYKLYDLIWKRFVASQMEDAVFDMLIVEIVDKHEKCLLRATGRTMKFEGYLKVYREEILEDSQEDGQSVLPPFVQGETLNLTDVKTQSHKTSLPPNYNEASLIKTLEKHGVGRPSTYAVIIKTILDRGYVRRNPKDKKILITDLGKLVTEKLKAFFPDIMDIDYTASIENGLDDIADGNMNWINIVKNFYTPFSNNLAAAQTGMKVSKPEPVKTQEKCPICKNLMVLRESRFGKYLSCSRFPKCRGKIPLDKDGNKMEVFAPITTEKVCSKCNKRKMLLRKASRGYFLACSGFPRCRNTEKISQEEVEKIINSARPQL